MKKLVLLFILLVFITACDTGPKAYRFFISQNLTREQSSWCIETVVKFHLSGVNGWQEIFRLKECGPLEELQVMRGSQRFRAESYIEEFEQGVKIFVKSGR